MQHPPPPAASSPGPGDDELRPLPTAARTRWRVQGGIVGAIAFLPVGVLLTVLAWMVIEVAGLLVGAVGLAAGAGIGVSWANRRYQRFGYVVDSQRVRVRDGVLIHVDAVAPLFRVQHVDMTRGPLQLAFDLATLSIHTASPAADITLPDLRAEDAERLRDEILTASRAAAAELGVADADAV